MINEHYVTSRSCTSKHWRIDCEKTVKEDPILQKLDMSFAPYDSIPSATVMIHIEPNLHSLQTLNSLLEIHTDLLRLLTQTLLLQSGRLVRYKAILSGTNCHKPFKPRDGIALGKSI